MIQRPKFAANTIFLSLTHDSMAKLLRIRYLPSIISGSADPQCQPHTPDRTRCPTRPYYHQDAICEETRQKKPSEGNRGDAGRLTSHLPACLPPLPSPTPGPRALPPGSQRRARTSLAVPRISPTAAAPPCAATAPRHPCISPAATASPCAFRPRHRSLHRRWRDPTRGGGPLRPRLFRRRGASRQWAHVSPRLRTSRPDPSPPHAELQVSYPWYGSR
jgi:hypothetical protein